jgi:nitrogen fixation NifU-like protein
MVYSDKVLSYFLDPAHAGEMANPDGIGPVGDPTCGDFFVVFIRVANGRIGEVSYQIYGCPAAIATCEAVAEMATGRTLEEAERITDQSVADFLGGLPGTKLHCSNSAAEALCRAIADYRVGYSRSQHAAQQATETSQKTEVNTNATR